MRTTEYAYSNVLTGGLPPPRHLLFLGGFQPPRPPGGGPAAPCASMHIERLRLSGSPFFLVPRSWYQDPGAKISYPKKNGELERRSLSKIERGGAGGCRTPPCVRGLEAPQEQQGVWGRQPPSKNNFMDPEPPSDHLQPLPTICQPPSTTFLPPSTTYRPPSPSTANHYHFQGKG